MTSADLDPPQNALARWLRKLVDVRAGEGAALWWSCTYFFCLLAGSSILRPVREALGLSGGAGNLPLLFTGTMVVMMLVNPGFALLVARLPRRRFLPLVYWIAIGCLLAFWGAFSVLSSDGQTALGYVFYVWLSVFNLFAVSVYWAFMADVWSFEQAKRLFGFLGIGGTAGAITGAKLAGELATSLGTYQILLVSVVFLAGAIACVRQLARLHGLSSTAARAIEGREVEERTDVLRGIKLVFGQPYLRAIALYTMLYALVGSFLYFQQGNLVEKHVPSRDERTELFARIDLYSQSATLFLQLFFTGRLIRRFGVTFALVSQPLVATLGWIGLCFTLWRADELAASGITPFGLPAELAMMIAVQVALRASNYATAKPARESLYTVVERDVKYKSKSFIDTLVYRFGDAAGAWSFKGLQLAGASLAGIATITVPIAAFWIGVGAVLGRRQRALTQSMPDSSATRPPRRAP